MTLKDIAAEAGVSISTVSRVINNTDTKAASPQVRERIWEIVRRTGYIPNHSAQTLKLGHYEPPVTNRSLSCLYARTPDAPDNPFFQTIAKSAEVEAYRQDYFLKSSLTPFNVNNEETYRLIQRDTNGVVVLGRCDKPTLKFLKQYCHNVIYTGLNPLDAKYDQVLCDGYEATLLALDYLRALGHHHIGYVGEIEEENRYRAYCDFMKTSTVSFDPSYRVASPLTSSGGYDGAIQLLRQQQNLTAIFCGDDIAAVGVLRAVRDFGLRVPEDISVISIDDIETSQYLSPMLTTVHVPMEEMGTVAAKILIDRINGGHTLPMQIKLPFYLAKRDSCAPPRKIAVM